MTIKQPAKWTGNIHSIIILFSFVYSIFSLKAIEASKKQTMYSGTRLLIEDAGDTADAKVEATAHIKNIDHHINTNLKL